MPEMRDAAEVQAESIRVAEAAVQRATQQADARQAEAGRWLDGGMPDGTAVQYVSPSD